LFSNKHVIVALIVGPVLAILAWLAVGEIAGKKAMVALVGGSYPLLEQSDCRYPSGHCKLENENFKLVMTLVQRGVDFVLVLSSVYPLDGVMISVGDVDDELRPVAMHPGNMGNKEWVISLHGVPGPGERIHLVASSAGTQYFGDAATLFIKRSK